MINALTDKLYIGDQNDIVLANDYYIVHAAKEPFHSSFVGYPPGKKAPEGIHRFFKRINNRLALNIVDYPKDFQQTWFPEVMLKESMLFIDEGINSGNKVLVHCNQGLSRAPSLVFMYLVTRGYITSKNFELAINEFYNIYPKYEPGRAIWLNIKNNYPFERLGK